MAARIGRDASLASWYRLTRQVLPAMATVHGWPVHLDHCFMRICLDEAVGAPWSDFIERPAVRTMSDEQLTAAIAVAEAIVADPSALAVLNGRSLAARRVARRR